MAGADDPLDELARELRASVEDELVAEAEEAERETRLGRLRARTVADVLTEAMHRGDRVRAATAGTVVAGSIAFVGTDYAVVAGPESTADVRLERTMFTIERSPEGGHTVRGGSATLRARLAEYEQTGEPVTLHTTEGQVRGVIRVAAADHVVVDDDGFEHVVPGGTISLVVRPLPGPR